MLLDYYAKIKVARALAQDSGLTIVLHDEEIQPYTDGISIHVMKPDPTWSPTQGLMWEYHVYHEIGHNHPEARTAFDLLEEERVGRKRHALWNLLEDQRQEAIDYDRYEGKRQIMARGRNVWYTHQVETNEIPDEEDAAKYAAAYAWDAVLRSEWQPELYPGAMKIIRSLPDTGHEWLDKLKHTGSDYDMRNLSAEGARDKSKELFDFLEFDEEEDEPEEQEGSGEGEGGEGEGSETDKYIAKTQYSDHTDSSGSGEGGVRYEDFDPSNASSGTYVPDANPVIHDLTSECPGGSSSWSPVEWKPSGRGLVKACRRVLQVLSESFWQNGYKSGKLGRKVHRACVDTGEYSRRVHKREIVNVTLDVAVLILVDSSGSMGGSKFSCASNACVALTEALCSINVPNCIVAFNEGGTTTSTCENFLIKDFGQGFGYDRIKACFDYLSTILANNADGESILWSYNHLISRPEPRKVLITLSDGYPACSKIGAHEFTKSVIESIEDSGLVEISAIGIEDDAVAHLYKDHVVINDHTELEEKLLKIVKNKLIS